MTGRRAQVPEAEEPIRLLAPAAATWRAEAPLERRRRSGRLLSTSFSRCPKVVLLAPQHCRWTHDVLIALLRGKHTVRVGSDSQK